MSPREELARIKAALDKLPPRPWSVWTSCSFRRIGGATGADGDVLHAYTQRGDGHPDLSMSEEQLQAIVDIVHAADEWLSRKPVKAASPEGEVVAWRVVKPDGYADLHHTKISAMDHALESGGTFSPLFALPPASERAEVVDDDKGNHDCLAKRRPGEPMFIILGRDPDGANTVRGWASRRLAAGGDPEHCQQGFATADRMQAYAADPANAPASAPPSEAYASAPDQQDEPVGWVLASLDGSWTSDPALAERWREVGWEPVALYASPPKPPEAPEVVKECLTTEPPAVAEGDDWTPGPFASIHEVHDKRVLLLASYCDPDAANCSEERPCADCLGMNNVALVRGRTKVLGGFDYLAAAPAPESQSQGDAS